MKFVFTGGGTGGHIFPAIAIADEVKKSFNDAEILFIGAKGKMEERVVPDNGYQIKLIDVSGMQRKNLLNNFKFIKNFIVSLRQSKKILQEFRPDVVIGTGGYVSAPVLYNAAKMGIKSLIQEGNSYPGLATKFLAKRVDKVIINFDETKNYLKDSKKIIHISYPIRSSLKMIDKNEAKKRFNINENNKTLFVFGGSQGASGINKGIENILDSLVKNNINIIWQVGKNDYQRLIKINKYENVKISEFINDMDFAYSCADLVVCRAGISSLMELSLMRKPAILIPYPFASENHQEKNALSLVNKDAAIMIKEKDINELLGNSILKFINDTEKLNKLAENISSYYDTDAPVKIVNEIKKLIN